MFIAVTHCSLQQRVKSARRTICTGTPENGDMARAFPFCPFKRMAMGAEVPFHHRARSKQILGVRRILPESPQTCPLSYFVQLCLQIFSHKDHEDLVLVSPPK